MLKIKLYFNNEKINRLLLKVTCVCWVSVKLLGWRMFTTYRLFPTAPVFNIFNYIPAFVHNLLFLISVLLLVCIFIKPGKIFFLGGLLITESFSFLLDQNRVQPWDYQYLFFLFIFIVNAKNQRQATIVIAFVVAATYFYSGLGKLNESFLQAIWGKMLLRLFFRLPAKITHENWIHYSGLIIGLAEMIGAACLLFVKTRKPAAIVLILMHLFILVFLGPLGINYNRIVWPWNLAMISYLYFIFLQNSDLIISFKIIFNGWSKLVFICWGILPAFNFAGYWDSYLSSGVYSGKLPQMLICIRDTGKCRPLRRFCQKDYYHVCGDGPVIDLQYWGMTETNVAPYPEIRCYKEIQQKLIIQYPGSGFSFFYFRDGKKINL